MGIIDLFKIASALRETGYGKHEIPVLLWNEFRDIAGDKLIENPIDGYCGGWANFHLVFYNDKYYLYLSCEKCFSRFVPSNGKCPECGFIMNERP